MPLPELVLLCGGLALVALAVAWRFSAHRSASRLQGADAVAAAAHDGIEPHADALLEVAHGERDEPLRAALAEAVARNQWEPSRDPRVAELRRWAQQRLDRTNATTVLVTGVGGAAGVSVVNALRARGLRVVGADADWLAAGLGVADDSGVLPRCDDPKFVDELCRLAARTGATVLISTIAEELLVLARDRAALAEVGLAAWLPDVRAVETCVDKWLFAQAVAVAGVPAPPTALGSGDGVAGPWIVKPRFGRGSRDVYTANDPDELAWALARVPQPIVQTRLTGMEFTVDALMTREGRLAGAVPRWRLETKAGISSKGRTFDDPELVEGVEALLVALGLDGPANVQGFVREDDGSFAFVEVNPRFSGGLPLSLAAGSDLVGEYLRGILGEPPAPSRLRYRAGTTMTRHLTEVYV